MARLETAMPIPTPILDKAKKAAAVIDADVYFYNGGIETPRCLACVEAISSHHSRKEAKLFLVTNGGNPDAAYKITRYLQERYDKFTVIVSGKCKSAGTLIAIGAYELAFTPYGELGPLDIQLTKIDRFDALQSGLTIQDSLNTLEARALNKFYEIVKDYMAANNGLLSFSSATAAASEFVTHLYAPVFSRIDPEEVGARARSMRIASDYGKRLAVKSQNLKPDTLRLLAETYSSHSFVIDQQEAETLFQRVRRADSHESEVVTALGRYARFEMPGMADFAFHALSVKKAKKPTTKATVNVTKSATKATGVTNAVRNAGGSSAKNGRNPQRPNAAANPPAAKSARRASTRAKNGVGVGA